MTANINTNIASLNAQRNLNVSQGSLATSLQRLSSGLRINSAKDDAAGLAISERFTSQIRGNNQAARNANDGISLAQTAEGGLSTAGDLLQRVRELAVQSANGSNSDSDRKSINNEVTSLTKELDRVANTTQFNGQNVLDGSLTSTQFQVGANANQVINIGVASAKASDIGNNTISPVDIATSQSQATTTTANNVAAPGNLTINSAGGVNTTVAYATGDSAKAIASKVNALTGNSGVTAKATSTASIDGITAADSGSVQFELKGSNTTAVTISASVVNGDLSGLAQAVNAQSATTNVSASVKVDPTTGVKSLQLSDNDGNDIAIKNTNATAATDVLTTANAGAGAALRGADIGGVASATTATLAAQNTTATVGGRVEFSSDSGFSIADSGGTAILGAASVGSSLQSVDKIDVSTIAGANKALLTIDSALTSINSNRASLGAIQNRFASTISNLQTTTENLSASRSRIQDTDFASETANLTRGQILQQAGTAILAQANSLPNGVLALLRG